MEDPDELASGSSQEGQRTESVGKLTTNVCYRCEKVGHSVCLAMMRNVVIVGKWAISKRLVATR